MQHIIQNGKHIWLNVAVLLNSSPMTYVLKETVHRHSMPYALLFSIFPVAKYSSFISQLLKMHCMARNGYIHPKNQHHHHTDKEGRTLWQMNVDVNVFITLMDCTKQEVKLTDTIL